jgi:hypothetical protein
MVMMSSVMVELLLWWVFRDGVVDGYRRFAGITSSTATRQTGQRGRVSGQANRGSIGRRPQGVRRRRVIAAWAWPSWAAVQVTRGRVTA